MLFAIYGQAVLVLYERYSKLVVALILAGKALRTTMDALKKILEPLPPVWRQTVTFDNGTEFARHYELNEMGIKTYFCDVRSPW